MAGVAQSSQVGGKGNYWLLLAALGALATLSGLFLPQLVPSDEAPLFQAASEVGASSGDLSYLAPSRPEGPSHRSMFIRLGVGTAVVLGLCVVTLLCGKRWLTALQPSGGTAGELRLVETLHLGNRCCLHLVQMSSRQVLVGADATGVKTVVPLSEAFESYLTPNEEGASLPR